MSNPWSREYAESRSPDFDDTVEVPLDEAPPAARHPAQTNPITPPAPAPAARWRRPRASALVAAAALAVAVAITAAVVVSGGDDVDNETASATTVDPFLLSDSVTTPPTLEPLDAPVVETAPPQTLEDPVATVPGAVLVGSDFAPVVNVDPADLAAYDLAAAVINNAPSDDPVRTMFKISGVVGAGDRPTIVSVTAVSDPVTQRDALTIAVGETTSRTIVDRSAHLAYRSSPALPPDSWALFSESDVVEGTDAADLGQLFDALVTGPITSALLARAEVTPSEGLVRLGGGAIARHYLVEVAADAIAPWGAMMFAASTESEVTSRDGDATLTFEVYVTDQPALALVTSQFEVDGEARALTQFFDRRPANVRIELPPAESVIGAIAD